ncbi:MAG TPA: hypothetical protein VGS07_32200 [Thermoanaerobaculia bacterium]|nr:hypothetical protein [Thermoanaerobaculia bacterium]
MEHVIRTYADYLQEVFSEQELNEGIFSAIGGVHRPSSENNHPPRCVGQYWPEYDYKLTGAEPKPETFFQNLMVGRRLADSAGEAFHVVEKIADSLLRLTRLSNPIAGFANRRRKHRYVLELLGENSEARARYLDLVTFLAIDRRMPTRSEWANRWSDGIVGLAEIIGGTKADRQTVAAFLEWQGPKDTTDNPEVVVQRDNLFRHPAATPKVRIRVSSIHSVKGETHTATLVVETYYRGHHLATLKPWLLGQKVGKGKERVINVSRLKQHYVAMTRPSHLLCLALKGDGFSTEEIDLLRGRGWRIARVTDGAPDWL